MRQAREIIRLKSTSISAHEISRRLCMARSTVREALKRAESAGLSWPLPEGMNDDAPVGVKRRLQRIVVHAVRQRPAQPGALRPLQSLPHR